MTEAMVEPGVCIGFGGTNARIADCEDGDVLGFSSVATPTEPGEFFGWVARNMLDASHEGKQWLVAGFPGPVSTDGRLVGPLANVTGMREERYDLREQLSAADSAVDGVFEDGFVLLAVNDGTLAAQAAASRVGEHQFGKTGAIIIGTGIGAGVVEKDPGYQTVHRVDTKNPLEIGHLLLGLGTFDSFEDRYSGPGMQKRYGADPRDLPADHPAWAEDGAAAGHLSLTLGLMNGVELVVPTGGVGAGASEMIRPHLDRFAKIMKGHGNGAQKLFMPEIRYVPPEECDVFEMYGAEGVMRDYLTSPAAAAA